MPRATFSKKNYLCSVCEKAFTTSGHLLRHSKVHTGEKKHKCPFPGCQTSCSRQDNLQQHYRIHLSPGSRRSVSSLLTKHSPPSTNANDRLGTSLSSTPGEAPTAAVSEEIPYTIVNGPPVLHLLPNGHPLPNPRQLYSPPLTPPPLQPAISYLRRPDRRHSTGTLSSYVDGQGYADLWSYDDSHYPLRPLSSSSASSSGTSSPPLSVECYGDTVSSNKCETLPSSSYHYTVVNDVSPSIVMLEDQGDLHQFIIATQPNKLSSCVSSTVHNDDLARAASYQSGYPMETSNNNLGYATIPDPACPTTAYSPSQNTHSSTTSSFASVSNATYMSTSSVGTHNDSQVYVPTFKLEDEQASFSNAQCSPQQYDSYRMFPQSSSSSSYSYSHSTILDRRQTQADQFAQATTRTITAENLGTNLGYGLEFW